MWTGEMMMLLAVHLLLWMALLAQLYDLRRDGTLEQLWRMFRGR